MEHVRPLSLLSDSVLVAALRALVARTREEEADLLRHVGEVDARKLYREHACSSMFTFCTERLGMSEGAAYRRIKVARLGRRLPIVLEFFRDGRVHLAGLDVLAAHLCEENIVSVLGRATGKSKREIQVLVCELAPKPDVAASVRRVSSASTSAPTSPGTGPKLSPGRVRSAKYLKSNTVAPLAPARYHVNFTASETLKDNLDRAKELAGYGVGVGELFERAMELLVADLEKKRLGVRGRKVAAPKNPRGRYIAKAIRRAVHERDAGQCTYVDGSGRRCSARRGLQLDHVVPHARGGESTAENLRLRCGPHNRLHAELCYGPLFMAEKRADTGISSDV